MGILANKKKTLTKDASLTSQRQLSESECQVTLEIKVSLTTAIDLSALNIILPTRHKCEYCKIEPFFFVIYKL